MKRYIFLLSLVLVFLLPNFLIATRREREPLPAVSFSEGNGDVTKNYIFIEDQNDVLKMELDDYILGVILGEMPADFETEALKAQAVAIRTYTLRSVEKGTKHLEGYLCTDASCCQAYSDPKDFPEEVIDKFRTAVKETADLVITYNGELIDATYFSCSGGLTEDAFAVWGADIPYLRSVDSPGEENAERFESILAFSRQEFLTRLGISESIKLSDSSFVVTYTRGGGVSRMYLADNCFTGVELRSLLELPSTAFTVTVKDDMVYIKSKGFGHRVGMSQYGADAMAISGNGFEEILRHYYPGTVLEYITSEQVKAIFDKAGNL